MTHDLEMHAGISGYAGLARIGGGTVNLCGLFRTGMAKGKGVDLLLGCLRAGGLRRLADRVDSAQSDPESFCGVAGFRFGRSGAIPFSLGDAAFMIPPFTGNGMSMALEAADLAIEPSLHYASGAIGWSQAAGFSDTAQRKHFRRRMILAGVIHPVMTSQPGLALMEAVARTGLLPYKGLYRLLR